MYDVLAKFEKGSKEYKEMEYRIACMQGYQQEIIDSIKGIIPKQVPSHWYNYKDVKNYYEDKLDKNGNVIKRKDNDEVIQWKTFNQKLLSDKKPYFFIYNYNRLKTKYNKYIENNNTNCLIKFGMTVNELINKENKNEDEKEFIKYYYLMMPVSMEKSLMNRLCWILEEEFKNVEKNIEKKIRDKSFDYTFLKLGVKYSKKDKELINKIYKEYKREVKLYMHSNHNSDGEDNGRQILINKYKKEIFEICNNEKMVCDILLDICYNSNQSKQFVWDISGDVIINRLLEINNYSINIPIVTQKETNTYWQGEYYKIKKVQIEKEEK